MFSATQPQPPSPAQAEKLKHPKKSRKKMPAPPRAPHTAEPEAAESKPPVETAAQAEELKSPSDSRKPSQEAVPEAEPQAAESKLPAKTAEPSIKVVPTAKIIYQFKFPNGQHIKVYQPTKNPTPDIFYMAIVPTINECFGLQTTTAYTMDMIRKKTIARIEKRIQTPCFRPLKNKPTELARSVRCSEISGKVGKMLGAIMQEIEVNGEKQSQCGSNILAVNKILAGYAKLGTYPARSAAAEGTVISVTQEQYDSLMGKIPVPPSAPRAAEPQAPESKPSAKTSRPPSEPLRSFPSSSLPVMEPAKAVLTAEEVMLGKAIALLNEAHQKKAPTSKITKITADSMKLVESIKMTIRGNSKDSNSQATPLNDPDMIKKCCAILNLDHNILNDEAPAAFAEVKQAFRALSMIVHPDKATGDLSAGSAMAFRTIEQAYKYLSKGIEAKLIAEQSVLSVPEAKTTQPKNPLQAYLDRKQELTARANSLLSGLHAIAPEDRIMHQQRVEDELKKISAEFDAINRILETRGARSKPSEGGLFKRKEPGPAVTAGLDKAQADQAPASKRHRPNDDLPDAVDAAPPPPAAVM